MYICADCFEEHQLKSGFGISSMSPCELCGPLKGNLERVFVNWEAELIRPIGVEDPKQFILDQLEKRKNQ